MAVDPEVSPEEVQQSPAHPAGHFAGLRVFVHEHPNLVAVGIAAIGLGITFFIWRGTQNGAGVNTVPQTSNDTSSVPGSSGGLGTTGPSVPSSADPTTTGLLGTIQSTLQNIQTTLATIGTGSLTGSQSNQDGTGTGPTYSGADIGSMLRQAGFVPGAPVNYPALIQGRNGQWVEPGSITGTLTGNTNRVAGSPSITGPGVLGGSPVPGGNTGVRGVQITPSSPMRFPDLPRYIAPSSGGSGSGARSINR